MPNPTVFDIIGWTFDITNVPLRVIFVMVFDIVFEQLQNMLVFILFYSTVFYFTLLSHYSKCLSNTLQSLPFAVDINSIIPMANPCVLRILKLSQTLLLWLRIQKGGCRGGRCVCYNVAQHQWVQKGDYISCTSVCLQI